MYLYYFNIKYTEGIYEKRIHIADYVINFTQIKII